jgi:predicted component of type VI protein secretion system
MPVERASRGAAPHAFLIDDRAGEAYQLGAAPLGIGRDPVSHIIVLDPSVSRFHAEVRSAGDGYTFTSMGATGSTLNGEKVAKPTRLNEGDMIGIGDTVFRFTRQRPAPDVVVIDPPENDDHVPRADAIDQATRQATMVIRTVEPVDGPLPPTPLTGNQALARRRLVIIVVTATVATIAAIGVVGWILRRLLHH